MPNRNLALALALLTAISAIALGCGSGSNPSRLLQSIAVTPATADAKDFPSGQVQFTATGTFSMPPTPEQLTFQTPYTGAFNTDASMVTVVSTSTGTVTVKCLSGVSGSTKINATACVHAGGGGTGTCVPVQGNAQLTCP